MGGKDGQQWLWWWGSWLLNLFILCVWGPVNRLKGMCNGRVSMNTSSWLCSYKSTFVVKCCHEISLTGKIYSWCKKFNRMYEWSFGVLHIFRTLHGCSWVDSIFKNLLVLGDYGGCFFILFIFFFFAWKLLVKLQLLE